MIEPRIVAPVDHQITRSQITRFSCATLSPMSSPAEKPTRVGTLASLRAAVSSRRIGAVTLQSFASGLPLGLVWISLPAWLTYRGVDIRTVGLFSLAQAPWTFKFLWAPLMDRYSPGFLGRKRSWMIVSQVFLLCYHYNPITGRYGGLVLATLRVASLGFLAAIAWWIFSMARRSAGGHAQIN